MTVYVVDASVASRFLLVEDLSDKAGIVLEDFLEGISDLSAPKLVVYWPQHENALHFSGEMNRVVLFSS